MSEWHVQVVRLGKIEKHPNADTLSITEVLGGYPVILRTGSFQEGDLAVYVPVESIVPADDQRWAFLDGHWRIRAKRLRGIFSMGLLTEADPTWEVGKVVHEELRITKYEPPEPLQMGGENEKDPGFLPCYTDIEGLRRWPNVLQPGEEVVITEKIHGANGRWLWHQDRFWAGSHRGIKRRDEDNLWWKAAARYGLEEALQRRPGLVFYGEVFGQVQDLKYGAGKNDIFVAMFDAMEVETRRYLDYDEFMVQCTALGLETVPVLYRGPWDDRMRSSAEGPTNWADGVPNHVREGFVVKPVRERVDLSLPSARVIFKLIGEGYHLRKGG
jgi:RNA ligase (TIGR02306 family)